ncbi:hypothetical protein AB0B31_35545 [Catellatospora citrea]|uniref:hypothetical protein n=1 Tax=Catellatospora citrea TaxID=53366 RepID=UPI0033F31E55
MLPLVCFVAGCGPRPLQLVGISRGADGLPIAVVHHCPEEPVTRISFFENSMTLGPSGLLSWTVSGSGLPESVTEVKLHEPPAGWKVSADTLQLGEADLGLGVSIGNLEVDGVSITSSDLAGLDPDKVWTSTVDGVGTALSREEFHRLAQESCP